MKHAWGVILIFMAVLRTAKAEEHGESIPGAGLSVLFIFGGLLYSGILKAMCDKVNVTYSVIQIPINPLLLITGLVLGRYHEHLGFVG